MIAVSEMIRLLVRTAAFVGLLAAAPAFASGSGPLPPGPTRVPIEPTQVDPGQLAGSTLSAVAFVPPEPGHPWAGQLQRMMLQAYLAPDGSTVVRRWLPDRNSYSVPERTNWSLSDNKLCIGVPTQSGKGDRSLCALVHVWWPKIAGVGTKPYAMLDGDLQRGNVIGPRAQR